MNSGIWIAGVICVVMGPVAVYYADKRGWLK
jgi:hypothetical protein